MRVLVLLLTLAALATPALGAGPKLMTDDELDGVSAQGVQLDLKINPDDASVDFSFNAGGTFGNGSVSTTGPDGLPSTIALNGTGLTLNNSTIQVENMILNLNICVQCQAEKIIQSGIGVPIVVKGQ